MLEELKERVFKTNIELRDRGLVIYTWGNVSGISDDRKYMVIKPSGVSYDVMSATDMVVIDINSGNVVDGDKIPSSDTPTHLELYRAFNEVGGIVHTHSTEAVAWAQSGRDIPVYGTTHSDYFYGAIPCTREMTEEEILNAYEKNTGEVIVDTFIRRHLNPYDMPAVLCRNHGSFTFGDTPEKAVFHAVVLEEVSKMARLTESVGTDCEAIKKVLLDKHFLRKHGKNAYYGQLT